MKLLLKQRYGRDGYNLNKNIDMKRAEDFSKLRGLTLWHSGKCKELMNKVW